MGHWSLPGLVDDLWLIPTFSVGVTVSKFPLLFFCFPPPVYVWSILAHMHLCVTVNRYLCDMAFPWTWEDTFRHRSLFGTGSLPHCVCLASVLLRISCRPFPLPSRGIWLLHKRWKSSPHAWAESDFTHEGHLCKPKISLLKAHGSYWIRNHLTVSFCQRSSEGPWRENLFWSREWVS